MNCCHYANCVNPDDWATPLRNDGYKVRIGLVGSVAYNQDFEIIKDFIRELDERNDVQLVLFGLWTGAKRHSNPLVEKTLKKEYKFWDSLKNKEHAPWVDMNYYFDQCSLQNIRYHLHIHSSVMKQP